MPKIKIAHIASFSSEDPVHPADNILSADTTKKWKCKSAADRTATVVLQLEKPQVISSIDIGNENSAYIEVLVSRSGSSDEGEYKVLLVMSSFMTPLEARQSKNPNAVRMFASDQLSKPNCTEKWDRVKIVCTQPFNRRVQFGLNFVNLHTNEQQRVSDVKKDSKVEVRPSSPDKLSAGSLFARRKVETPLKAAAAIRNASNQSSVPSPVITHNLSFVGNKNRTKLDDTPKKMAPRNRAALLYTEDEEGPNAKIDRLIEAKLKEREEEEAKAEAASKRKKAKEREEEEALKRKKAKEREEEEAKAAFTPKRKTLSNKIEKKIDSTTKRKATPTTSVPKRAKIARPFKQLLKGVILVISGIQNPDRANLRKKALKMGAKYKPDWDATCTHLICAFANTPKFNLVKGKKGKIVTKKWLDECYSSRKRLPWRRFALDKGDLGQPESEDEICEETLEATLIPDADVNDDGSDTEDELRRVQARIKKRDSLIYEMDTDEEVKEPPEWGETIKKPLRTFFENKRFYVDELSFDKNVVKNLFKYIAAYKGEVNDNPVDDINFYITTQKTSRTIKEINAKAFCLRAEWVWLCHNSQKLMPYDDFVV